jgi:hypothetical protein
MIAHDLASRTTHPIPADLITGISPQAYSPHPIRIGSKVYIDRAFVISRIPPRLHGLPAVQTANVDYDTGSPSSLQFCLTQSARIYVAYESSVKRVPEWLRQFEPENMRIEIEDEFALIRRTMQLYGKDYPPGIVSLGGNQAEGYEGDVIVNYFVIVQPRPNSHSHT